MVERWCNVCDTCDTAWTGVNCDTCAIAWTGNNCDTWDPKFCADGVCSSCMNGQCTDNGCVGDAGWYGDKCDRVYDEGCPCFNGEDVDTLLNYAEIAGANASLGSCDYSEDIGSYTSLNVYFNYPGPTYSIYVSETQCSSFRTKGIYVPINATESGECSDVIVNAGAKNRMADAGCFINVFLD